MRFRAALMAFVIAGVPAAAFGQYGSPYGTPRSASIIRQAGMWDNYVTVPDGHCGCAMPVQCDSYAHCCNRCNLNPCCLLKRVGRMLDCLLPCNKCCGGGCLIGGCGGCGNCTYGYSGHSAGCPTCTTGAPPLSNPFEDDPAPPKPEPAVESDVHYHPAWKSPQQITRDPRPSSQARGAVPTKIPSASSASRPQPAVREGRPRVAAARPAVPTEASQKSVLRRTSLEEAVEPEALETPEATPISAAPIVQSDNYWAGVPHNPLRKN